MSAVLKLLRRQRKPRRRAPVRRPRWQLAVLGLCAVATLTGLGLIAHALVTAPFLEVRELAVHGNERLTPGALRPVLAGAIGQPILLVSLEDLRAKLEASPGVRRASVARRMPDLIEATIVERRAVARAEIGGRIVLIDEEAMAFAPVAELPTDDRLPLVRGLLTPPGQVLLLPSDRCAIDAILALEKVIGGAPPEDTTLDLRAKDRIVLRPGREAPALWLDRGQPERNLKSLFAWKDRVAQLAPGGSIDLRFKNRLTVVPAPPEADGTTAE